MKKLLILLALLGPVWKPAFAAQDGVGLDVNTRVSVSTSSPTALFASTTQARGSKIKVNPIDGTQTAATNDAILIGTSSSASDYSTSASTGTTRVHAGDKWFGLDGSFGNYQGPLYGLAVSTGPLNVDRFRAK